METKLKSDLHLHSGEDKQDNIPYSAEELLAAAAKMNFSVLSFTFHKQVFFPKQIERLASRRGILLIPGCEMQVQNRHVLIYNKSASRLKAIVSKIQSRDKVSDISKHKADSVVIAPHPYYVNPIMPWKSHCLRGLLDLNIDLFDAVEFSHFYYRLGTLDISFNSRAAKIAVEAKKTLVGTSDCHRLCQLGSTYSLIESKKHVASVLSAIVQGNVTLVTRPLSLKVFLKLGALNLLQKS